jgi:elongation factor Tu
MFLLPIEDKMSRTGRGTVVTGKVESGDIKIGEEVQIVGVRDTIQATVIGVEMFKKQLDHCEAGDNVAILLRGIREKDIERGMVLVRPYTIQANDKFKATIIFNKEEGSYAKAFTKDYKAQFYFRTIDITGQVMELFKSDSDEVSESAVLGDSITVIIKLVYKVAMTEGLRFEVREKSGRTIGLGEIIKVIS